MPGFSFPPVGPSGFGSPPSRPSPSGHRYYDRLRLPLLPLRSLRLRSFPDTLRSPAFVRLAFREGSSPVSTWQLLYSGLPIPVPSARRWRSSQVPRLPLYVHAPLADCGGVLSTRLGVSWTLAFRLSQTVGFPRKKNRVILSDHNYKFFAALSRGLHTRYTWLHTHPHGYACRFTTDLAAHLFWWDSHRLLCSPTG
jgi:hypothetical protein